MWSGNTYDDESADDENYPRTYWYYKDKTVVTNLKRKRKWKKKNL